MLRRRILALLLPLFFLSMVYLGPGQNSAPAQPAEKKEAPPKAAPDPKVQGPTGEVTVKSGIGSLLRVELSWEGEDFKVSFPEDVSVLVERDPKHEKKIVYKFLWQDRSPVDVVAFATSTIVGKAVLSEPLRFRVVYEGSKDSPADVDPENPVPKADKLDILIVEETNTPFADRLNILAEIKRQKSRGHKIRKFDITELKLHEEFAEIIALLNKKKGELPYAFVFPYNPGKDVKSLFSGPLPTSAAGLRDLINKHEKK